MVQTRPPIREGVTRFVAKHTPERLSSGRFEDLVKTLAAWRTLLAGLTLIGQDPARYDGAGYGNVSARIGPYPGSRGRRPFLVSGTQTGGSECVSLDEFSVVESYDWRLNEVTSRGAVAPSSESMTHGSFYDLGGHIRFVFHVHCPVLWQAASVLGIPLTADGVDYGTPEMAGEIERLGREGLIWEKRIVAMSGHEDGVIAFGRSADEAGHALMSSIAEAYALSFERTGRLCAPKLT